MIQDNKIILHKLKIILKLLQDFQEEIKYIEFKLFPMGHLTKVNSPPEDSNKIISTNKKIRYQSGF